MCHQHEILSKAKYSCVFFRVLSTLPLGFTVLLLLCVLHAQAACCLIWYWKFFLVHNSKREDIFCEEAVTSWLTNITFLNFLARSRDIVGNLLQRTFTDCLYAIHVVWFSKHSTSYISIINTSTIFVKYSANICKIFCQYFDQNLSIFPSMQPHSSVLPTESF